MAKLDLSIMDHSLDPVGDLRPWLAPLETEKRLTIDITMLRWEDAWPQIVNMALYGKGPDVSELGSTWVGDIANMNVLRPFQQRELIEICAGGTILKPLWDMLPVQLDQKMRAIPWLAYTRVIYYRRDMLIQAGIDERSAFLTHESLYQTVKTLADNGVEMPWVVPIHGDSDMVHNLASWIWGAGGEFISADGKKVLFGETEARKGFHQYLELARLIPESARAVISPEAAFSQGKAAIIISGPWLWENDLQLPEVSPEVVRNTGAACLPGVPLIGASHLVIWKHTVKEQLALELLRRLMSEAVQANYARLSGLLPVLTQVLECPPFSNDPVYQVMIESLKKGRAFPSVPLWGMIENKLLNTLDKIMSDVLVNRNEEIDLILDRHLELIKRRLNITISQS